MKDVNFIGIISYCSLKSNCNNFFSNKIISIQKKIDSLSYNLRNIFETLKKAAPDAQIYVLGYPYLFGSKYDNSCNISIFIEPEEQKFLNNMTEQLNHVIKEAALDAGIIFLSVAEAFSGHGICSEDPWINSLESSLLESFHPNMKGQKAYADVKKFQ